LTARARPPSSTFKHAATAPSLCRYSPREPEFEVYRSLIPLPPSHPKPLSVPSPGMSLRTFFHRFLLYPRYAPCWAPGVSTHALNCGSLSTRPGCRAYETASRSIHGSFPTATVCMMQYFLFSLPDDPLRVTCVVARFLVCEVIVLFGILVETFSALIKKAWDCTRQLRRT